MKSLDIELLLEYIKQEMEKQGLKTTNYHFNLDQEFVDACNRSFSIKATIQEYEEVLRIGITREYIQYTTLDPGFSGLALTQKGLGVATSSQRDQELRQSKTSLKKLSDWMMDHQGILLFIMAAAAVITIVITIIINFKAS